MLSPWENPVEVARFLGRPANSEICEINRALVLLSGHTMHNLYVTDLKNSAAAYEVVWLRGKQLNEYELPCAYLEYDDLSETSIKRLTLVVFHREYFARENSMSPTRKQRACAIRERLIDLAQIFCSGTRRRRSKHYIVLCGFRQKKGKYASLAVLCISMENMFCR